MKVEKIGDNHIKVIKTKKVYDNVDKTKFVEIDDEPFEVGIKGIDDNIASCQAQIDFLNDATKRAAQIILLQEKLDEWNLIKQSLNE